MKENYLREIIRYFVSAKWEDFDAQTIHQAKRCLLDYCGCAVFAAAHGVVPKLCELAKHMGNGNSRVWGGGLSSSSAAVLLNASRTSHIEMDDCSGIGAGVHPGVYVITAALAQAQESGSDTKSVLRAIIFGYDICQRMGMLAAESVRELGLHGPGMIGGLGAAASAGILAGLNEDELYNAIAVTACLMPVCPFVSFMEGAGVKDLYGGWGAYLGMTAVAAARLGITAPEQALDGEKSLKSILKGQKGRDVKPGEHFYINDVAFKEFSACHSVHPALNAVLALKKQYAVEPSQIEKIEIETYPYSYALNLAVKEPLNPSSARLSLPYTAAVALTEGELSPKAFFEEALQGKKYRPLMEKITVKSHDDYGDGPFGTRGSIVSFTLKDGRVLSEETTCAKWSNAPPDDALQNKFELLAGDSMTPECMNALSARIWDFENGAVKPLVELLQSTDAMK